MKARILLAKIVAKGGIIGHCGIPYLQGEMLSSLYINEMKEQLHVNTVMLFWGQDLVAEIRDFRSGDSGEMLYLKKEPIRRIRRRKKQVELLKTIRENTETFKSKKASELS